MRISVHVLVSAIICALLFPFYGWNALFVIVGGVLIDIDHYLLYIGLFKDANFIKAYKYHKSIVAKAYNHPKSISNDMEFKRGNLCIFHTIEFLLLLLLLSYFHTIPFLIMAGVLSHYILDIIFQVSTFKSIVMAPSILLWMRKTIFS